MANILLKDLWKKYGEVEAVKGINLEIKHGEFFCFLGPSGCGKTSTLRMIAGLEQITAGEIRFDDQVINDLAPAERDVAMAFETYALYPTMSIFENIAFPLRARGQADAEVQTKVMEAARILDLTDALDRKPHEVSGGHQQRVSLGRCIVRHPNVFLFDEPLSHVDSEARRRMRGEIARLQEILGTTAIYVTHDQLEAIALADRIAVMNFGEILQVGTPEEVYHEPRNIFVADFIGEPPFNFLDATVTRSNGAWAFTAQDQSCEMPVPPRLTEKVASKKDQQVTVGIRPMYITASLAESPTCHIKGSVYVFENLGERGILTVDVGGTLIRVLTNPDFGGEIDAPVWLTLDMGRLHAFDPDTTSNLLWT